MKFSEDTALPPVRAAKIHALARINGFGNVDFHKPLQKLEWFSVTAKEATWHLAVALGGMVPTSARENIFN